MEVASCLGKGVISSYSFCGVPGDSLCPHWVCLHARVVWGWHLQSTQNEHTVRFHNVRSLGQNPKGEIIERLGEEWAEVVNQSPQKASM